MKFSENLLDESWGHRMVLSLAWVFSISLVALIWWFRFLPLYDYPIWLYNVHVMVHLSDPHLAPAYDLVKTPVPNLGLVGLVWIMSHVVSIEIAGKIVSRYFPGASITASKEFQRAESPLSHFLVFHLCWGIFSIAVMLSCLP